MTTLFPYIKQELSTADSFLRTKYGLSCFFTFDGHPHKTKSITFKIIRSLFEISPISLDVTGTWINACSVMDASLFTEKKLAFSFEGKRLKSWH